MHTDHWGAGPHPPPAALGQEQFDFARATLASRPADAFSPARLRERNPQHVPEELLGQAQPRQSLLREYVSSSLTLIRGLGPIMACGSLRSTN